MILTSAVLIFIRYTNNDPNVEKTNTCSGVVTG